MGTIWIFLRLLFYTYWSRCWSCFTDIYVILNENKTKKEILAKVTDKQKFGIPSDITHTMVTRLYLKKVCVFKDFGRVVNSVVSDARKLKIYNTDKWWSMKPWYAGNTNYFLISQLKETNEFHNSYHVEF